MRVFLDTSCEDLCLLLLGQDGRVIYQRLVRGLREKVGNLPTYFEEMLNVAKIELDEIQASYVTVGPGSFTGSRIGALYLRTLSQLRGIPLFTIESIKLIVSSNQIVDGEASVRVGRERYLNFEIKGSEILSYSVSKRCKGVGQIDYDYLYKNFDSLAPLFKEERDLLGVAIAYYLQPQVG